jgi:hypothetical protein
MISSRPFVVAMLVGLLLVCSAGSVAAGSTQSDHFHNMSASSNPVAPLPLTALQPGCLTGYATSIGAETFSAHTTSTAPDTPETLAADHMDITNTCTGGVEPVAAATEIPRNAFTISWNAARVVADVPYRDTVIHLEASWACAAPRQRIEGPPTPNSFFCDATMSGTLSFRGETFGFAGTGYLSANF